MSRLDLLERRLRTGRRNSVNLADVARRLPDRLRRHRRLVGEEPILERLGAVVRARQPHGDRRLAGGRMQAVLTTLLLHSDSSGKSLQTSRTCAGMRRRCTSRRSACSDVRLPARRTLIVVELHDQHLGAFGRDHQVRARLRRVPALELGALVLVRRRLRGGAAAGAVGHRRSRLAREERERGRGAAQKEQRPAPARADSRPGASDPGPHDVVET